MADRETNDARATRPWQIWQEMLDDAYTELRQTRSDLNETITRAEMAEAELANMTTARDTLRDVLVRQAQPATATCKHDTTWRGAGITRRLACGQIQQPGDETG